MNSSSLRIIGVVAVLASSAEAATRFAKVSAPGSPNCLSWANACTLSTALDGAAPGDEVWVKAGTYDSGLTLKNGVKIIGGFAGTESAPSQSNPAINVTIIDGGGVEGTDNPPPSPTVPATVLRGFTIRNGTGDPDGEGGGMILKNSNALVVHCVFEDNTASQFGGAVSVHTGSPKFINCTFRNNGQGAANPQGTNGGGAAFVRDGTPEFVNCLFDNNRAWEGGVVLPLSGAPTFINCTLVNNKATVGYGGVFLDPDGNAVFRNCILTSNTTTKGAGRYDHGYTGSAGTTPITYSNVLGGWSGTANISDDPLFVNPSGGNYQLLGTSPSYNTGENAARPPDVGDVDWDGNTSEPIPRDLNGFTRLRFVTIDMGAYEVQTAGQ